MSAYARAFRYRRVDVGRPLAKQLSAMRSMSSKNAQVELMGVVLLGCPTSDSKMASAGGRVGRRGRRSRRAASR